MMSRDDLIYGFVLLLGVGFGHFYRKIGDVALKQLTGTLFGLMIVIFVTSHQSLHIFFSFLVSCVIIKVNER
jgi:hypothetical protein